MRDPLAQLATGRIKSRFAADVSGAAGALGGAIGGRRLLVVGGAGSIGAATVRALLAYAPAAVDVLDLSENGLAELVRDLRSDAVLGTTALRCLPLDYGSSIARRFIVGANEVEVP